MFAELFLDNREVLNTSSIYVAIATDSNAKLMMKEHARNEAVIHYTSVL